MESFTLDTNCIIAVERNEHPEKAAVLALATAHTDGRADVAVVAISASENQQGSALIQDFGVFRARLSRLGLGDLNILLPLAYSDISFHDMALWADNEMVRLEKHIHGILFPRSEFLLGDYCRANNLPLTAAQIPRDWRNKKCDVQTLWSHLHHHRKVFVTSDGGFHRKQNDLIALGVGAIEYPAAAAMRLP